MPAAKRAIWILGLLVLAAGPAFAGEGRAALQWQGPHRLGGRGSRSIQGP